MQILPSINLYTDKPFWICKTVFLSAFDQLDFSCRNVQDVDLTYRSDWFDISYENQCRFIVPVVGVVGGKTQFISGRHRTAVLLEYLDEIPVAFAMGHLDDSARRIVESIPKRELILSEYMKFPDLPVRN